MNVLQRICYRHRCHHRCLLSKNNACSTRISNRSPVQYSAATFVEKKMYSKPCPLVFLKSDIVSTWSHNTLQHFKKYTCRDIVVFANTKIQQTYCCVFLPATSTAELLLLAALLFLFLDETYCTPCLVSQVLKSLR